jgi:hypothetical protein
VIAYFLTRSTRVFFSSEQEHWVIEQEHWVICRRRCIELSEHEKQSDKSERKHHDDAKVLCAFHVSLCEDENELHERERGDSFDEGVVQCRLVVLQDNWSLREQRGE